MRPNRFFLRVCEVRSAPGRGRAASFAATRRLAERSRGAMVKARVVRHGIKRAPLTAHLLGGEARVPTPDGRRLALTIPEGTQDGRVFRLRGQGMGNRAARGGAGLSLELAREPGHGGSEGGAARPDRRPEDAAVDGRPNFFPV